MAKQKSRRLVIPDEKAARLYGRITLIIGGVLLACGFGMGGMYLIAPAMKPFNNRLQAWSSRFVEEAERKRLRSVVDAVESATTPAEKAQANSRLTTYLDSDRPNIQITTPGFDAVGPPIVQAYGIADAVVGVALNVAMVIAAAGLTGLREWGRKSLLIVAGLKLTRLVVFGVIMLGWVLPVQIRAMKENMAPLLAKNKGMGPGAAMTPEFFAAITTSSVILWAIVASIYPILLLVQLSRPRVQAACVTSWGTDEDLAP